MEVGACYDVTALYIYKKDMKDLDPLEFDPESLINEKQLTMW